MIYAFTVFFYLMGWAATGLLHASVDQESHYKYLLLIWLILFFLWAPLIFLSCWDGVKATIWRSET